MGEPLVTAFPLRFCDTDRLGHINNAVYAVMFEAGRTALLDPLGLVAARAHAVVIARLEIDFLREINWPGTVRIETEIARIGGKSLHVRQRLLVDGDLVSRGRSVLAVIDAATRRAVPITLEWRDGFAPWVVTDDSAP